MDNEAAVKAAAQVIRQRCCRAADGLDIPESQSLEIARDVLRAAQYSSREDQKS